MFARKGITGRGFFSIIRNNSAFIRDCYLLNCFHIQKSPTKTASLTHFLHQIACTNQQTCLFEKGISEVPRILSSVNTSLCWRSSVFESCVFLKCLQERHMSNNASVELKTDEGVVRFNINKEVDKSRSTTKGKKVIKRVKMSRKAKRNELRFYRLKAKKKMNSPNPEVRIRYKLEKAKRKEEWLIEKLRKFDIPKAPAETYDPEILTEEEIFYLKRTGEKKKNYAVVGRRGVFGGVVLNMHLHWKKHETVKVFCKPCKPGQIYEYAEELTRLSKGVVIDIKPNNSIIFYRGKNYVQPKIISPPDTLSKAKALEKYRYEQSLEHTSQFIEKLEKELEAYHEYIERYRKDEEKKLYEQPTKAVVSNETKGGCAVDSPESIGTEKWSQ